MIKEKIQKILNYLSESEEQHFEESGRPKDHIFNDVKEVQAWIYSPSCPLVDEEELEEIQDSYNPCHVCEVKQF